MIVNHKINLLNYSKGKPTASLFSYPHHTHIFSSQKHFFTHSTIILLLLTKTIQMCNALWYRCNKTLQWKQNINIKNL